MNDSEVDLYAYEPFKESEKLARLDQQASFKIVGEVPIIDGARLSTLYFQHLQKPLIQKIFMIHIKVLSLRLRLLLLIVGLSKEMPM
ncbi:hypothetical protein BB777_07290 [Planococcus faecalis]|nr:hypothetical protein BB777_07290 [Planococcus faecalis]